MIRIFKTLKLSCPDIQSDFPCIKPWTHQVIKYTTKNHIFYWTMDKTNAFTLVLSGNRKSLKRVVKYINGALWGTMVWHLQRAELSSYKLVLCNSMGLPCPCFSPFTLWLLDFDGVLNGSSWIRISIMQVAWIALLVVRTGFSQHTLNKKGLPYLKPFWDCHCYYSKPLPNTPGLHVSLNQLSQMHKCLSS